MFCDQICFVTRYVLLLGMFCGMFCVWMCNELVGSLGLMGISHHVYISNLFSVGIGGFTGGVDGLYKQVYSNGQFTYSILRPDSVWPRQQDGSHQ